MVTYSDKDPKSVVDRVIVLCHNKAFIKMGRGWLHGHSPSNKAPKKHYIVLGYAKKKVSSSCLSKSD